LTFDAEERSLIPGSEVSNSSFKSSKTLGQPDLNPVENIVAKVKNSLRSLACRTKETLCTSMQSVLDQITASDADN
jgi:hypothetical protein